MVKTRLAKMTRVAAAVILGLWAAPAMAQIAQNSDAPVDLTADELEVINAQCLAVWRGAAEALQDTSRLRADILKIYNKPGPPKPGGANASCGAVQRMEAQGNVFYVTPSQRVRADNAVYDKISDTIVLTGDVVAVQDKNVLRGERMVINVKTGQAQMQTSVRGRNNPGRVRGVFYPSDKKQAAAGK